MSTVSFKHLFRQATLFATLCTILLSAAASASSVRYVPAGRSELWVQSDILYYKPTCETGYGTLGTATDLNITGNSIIEMIWNGLLSFLTPEQAAGVMGNMMSESGFRLVVHEYSAGDTNILTDSSSAHGIGLVQWSFGRRVNLLNYIQQNNPSLLHYFTDRATYSNLSPAAFLATAGQADTAALVNLELNFLKQELETSYSGFFSTTTVASATAWFLEKFERPRNPYIEYHQGRITQANGIYSQYSGSTSPAASPSLVSLGYCVGSGSDGTGIARDNGDINSTALALAWTSVHNWDDPSSAYLAAMQALGIYRASGKDEAANLGGSCDIFVATVMRYSGADPNFPLYLSQQKGYLASSPLYEVIPNTGSTANLRPGDIRIENGSKHIAMVVQRADGSLGIASASHGERSADVSNYYHDSSAIIYRLRGSANV